jgi:hypothetical protein
MTFHQRTLGVGAAIMALAAAGCGGGASREDFTRDVQEARNRVDASLVQITRSRTVPQLLQRMRAAAKETQLAAEDLDEADTPDGLGDETDRLVDAFFSFATEVEGTANQIANTTLREGAEQLEGLSFQSWFQVQNALQALRDEGIDVQLLQRR